METQFSIYIYFYLSCIDLEKFNIVKFVDI